MNLDTGLASVETKGESSLIHHRVLIEKFSATQQIIRSHKCWTSKSYLMATYVACGYIPHTHTHSSKHVISPIRRAGRYIHHCLLGQVVLDTLECCAAVSSLLHAASRVGHHQWPPSYTVCSSASVHSTLKRRKGHCHTQQLHICCLAVPCIHSSLDSRLAPNTSLTLLLTPMMSGTVLPKSKRPIWFS